MKYFKLLFLLLPFFTVACNQEPGKQTSKKLSPFEEQPKTPLEEQINKITNTVLLEPLRALKDDSRFYGGKQYLFTALDNSTQKDIFFTCEEFKKSLLTLLQTDYSTDFVSESWQRTEVEKLAQSLSKEQCADIHTLRASFLADLQSALNSAETKDAFINSSKPVIEHYAKDILNNNEYYIDLLNKTLVPYKKLREIFYPLEKAGYNTYILEQTAFKNLRQLVTPGLQGRKNDEDKINNLLNKAQENEKILFVFLKKYESLTQTNGECINQFFPGLKEKWYEFMYEIEKLPAEKRQAYADKRYNQANDGLRTKCAQLIKTTKKQKTAQGIQEQPQQEPEYYQEEEEEEVYDF